MSNERPPGPEHPSRPPRLDPTKVTNQPALRTSSGRIWLIVGALFAAASFIPLTALIFVDPGPSAPIAVGTALAIALLYVAIVVVRFAVPAGPKRLRLMAACLILMAVAAVGGLMWCVAVAV